MEIGANHSITYTTQGDVPVPIVTRSLLSNERLIHEGFRLLSDLYPQLKTPKIRVKVSYLSNQSPLKETLAVGLFLAYQEDLEKEVPELVEALTGVQIPDSADTLVTVLVLAVALYLVHGSIERLLPGKSVKNLREELNNKINTVAEWLQMSPEAVRATLDQRYKKSSRTLARKAQHFFSPAKIERGTEIQSDSGYGVGKGAIAEVPGAIDLAKADASKSYELTNVRVEIHRADRDTYKYGWRSVIHQVSDRKVRMELSPEIPPENLYGTTYLVGDVIVIEEQHEDGSYSPKTYHLIRVRTQQG